MVVVFASGDDESEPALVGVGGGEEDGVLFCAQGLEASLGHDSDAACGVEGDGGARFDGQIGAGLKEAVDEIGDLGVEVFPGGVLVKRD